MKRVILLATLIFAIGTIGVANAQSSGRVVSPKTATESGRTVSDAVSDSAKDAMKQADQKPGDMKIPTDKKMKSKKAEDALKMKGKMK